jgi:hypothetical protein
MTGAADSAGMDEAHWIAMQVFKNGDVSFELRFAQPWSATMQGMGGS